MCEPHRLIAVEPLFGCSTEVLFNEWVASHGEASIVTARCQFFDETWLGRPLRAELISEFHRLGVDPCGELGEYHTVVTDSPLFTAPIRLTNNGYVQRSGCWALDVLVDDAQSE
jgi:diphthamide synthase (EF-2-diphthine--ammonia ligase)